MTDRKSWLPVAEVAVLVLLFFAIAGVAPPAVNEAHYFAKSKNYWDPGWCANDLFASSGNPHWLFHVTFGALTQWFSLEATAWMGRLIGWTLIACGLTSLTRALTSCAFASLPVAAIWIAATYGFNLAGEWIIGGIEGKVPAYAFLLFALRCMVVGNWSWVWPLLGLASGFHVLVGGWSTCIALVIYGIHGRHQQPMLSQALPLVLGGLIALTGIVPALQLTSNVPHEVATAAARIYSYQRLTHHLLPNALNTEWYLRHLSLIGVTGIFFVQWSSDRIARPLKWFVIGSVGLAVIGYVIGQFTKTSPDLVAGLLRYYWFRLTDSMVPLGLALAWARLPELVSQSRLWSLLRVGLLIAALPVLVAMTQETSDMTVVTDAGRVASAIGMNTTPANRQRVVSDWVTVCEWVDRTLPADELLLTPRNQQTFKWYANRAEVVNWKDVPQDAASLVEWKRRFYDVFPLRLGTVRVTVRYPDLKRFKSEYGVRYMIVDRRFSGSSLPLVQVYPRAPWEQNETYAVYQLP